METADSSETVSSIYKTTQRLTQEDSNYYVGSEVLTAVVMKSTVFWDITPCSPLKVNRNFGGTYRLHLQFEE
jgi:hypothetical protein